MFALLAFFYNSFVLQPAQEFSPFFIVTEVPHVFEQVEFIETHG